MPSSSAKNKDTGVVETGRPFSPAMFEGVLKAFTPDVPSTISGRPRFVFYLLIFFLSSLLFFLPYASCHKIFQ